MPALTLGSELYSLLVLGQEWKQAAEGLMLWMEEKWPRVADEGPQTGSNTLQWHKITKSELLASHRYMEDLQQVRMPTAGAGPSCPDSSTYFPAMEHTFHGAQSLKVLSASCT